VHVSRSIQSSFGAVVAGLVVGAAGLGAFQATQPAAPAPPAAKAQSPQQLDTAADHQKMMDLLHIDKLRRGADGNNKDAPNYANYDESKANPYPNYPDPLVMKNGKKVTSAKMWMNQRRPEIVEDFDREIYGRVPKNVPKVKWEVKNTTEGKNGDVDIVTKQLVGHVDNSSYPQVTVDIQTTLTLPAHATGPVPVMILFGGGAAMPGGCGPAAVAAAAAAAANPAPAAGAPGAGRGGARAGGRGGAPGGAARGPQGPTAQQQMLAKGWGYANLSTGSVQEDNGAGLCRGIIGLVNKGQPRKPDDWGVLRAWAWGASRVLDYLETDKAVNAKEVGLEGHSRWGKATIVAMAYDQRFAIAYVSSSGEGGAKMHRRNWGELVENVAANSEYHWMAGNFLKYAGPLNWNDLPVDSHELVAMCAPRPVFISGGSASAGDGWVDAKGMFLAGAYAGPVYKLLGKKDMGTTEFPPMETALIDGDVAFRQHSGGHTDGPNWPTFLTFASRYIKSPVLSASR
jgi:hypothetical protein